MVWVPSLRYGQPALLDSSGGRQNSLRSDNCRPDPASVCAARPSPTGGGDKYQEKFGEARTRLARPRRSPIPYPLPTHHPSGCAEERRSSWIRTGDCLSAASSSPAPAGPSTTGCPRSASEGGRRQQGRLFFCLLFFWRDKRKVSCRRATPGLQAHHKKPRPVMAPPHSLEASTQRKLQTKKRQPESCL